MIMAKCNLCGTQDNHSVVWNKTDRANGGVLYSKVVLDDKAQIIHGTNVICNICGLIFVDPMMSPAELATFYDGAYREIYPSSDVQQLDSERFHANQALKLVPKGVKTHMDIGASNGLLVELLSHYNINSIGLEADPTTSANARKHGRKVFNINFDNYDTDERYDLITMLNALEHTHNPRSVLSKIKSLLTPQGYALVSVPDIFNLNIKRPLDAYLSNAHTYNFSVHTLSEMMRSVGLKPVVIRQFEEEIGNKLYILAQVDDTQVVKGIKPPNADQVRAFLNAINDAYVNAASILGGV
jgi:2-polyprenyl-3-methyl-5-hydroxy-6-metoxy-1,4-benzoquinol methylase